MNTAGLLILQNIKSRSDKSASSIITYWYDRLQQQSAMCAELRHASTPEALLLCAGFRELAHQMHHWLADTQWHWLGLALGAGVAAHVRTNHKQHSFAAQLGLNKPQTAKPVLSPLRFSRLSQARNHHELYRRIIQAIRQLNGDVNLLSVMDGILLWCREYEELHSAKPSDRPLFERLALRWACEYYQATEMTEE